MPGRGLLPPPPPLRVASGAGQVGIGQVRRASMAAAAQGLRRPLMTRNEGAGALKHGFKFSQLLCAIGPVRPRALQCCTGMWGEKMTTFIVNYRFWSMALLGPF